jgi:hypothetical protein
MIIGFCSTRTKSAKRPFDLQITTVEQDPATVGTINETDYQGEVTRKIRSAGITVNRD